MNVKLKPGLLWITNYNRIFGNTFWTSINGSNNKCLKLIMAIWNLCFLVLISAYFVWTFNGMFKMNEIMDKYSPSPRKGFIFILFILGHIANAIELLFVFFVCLIRGKTILQFMNSQCNIEVSKEKKIAFKVILIQMAIMVFYTLLTPIINLTKASILGTNYNAEFDIIVSFIFFIINNCKMTLLSLIAYQTRYYEQAFEVIKINFSSLSKFTEIYGQILHLMKSAKLFNTFINKYLFITIAANSITCVSLISIAYHNSFTKVDYEITGVIICLINLMLICWYCNKVTASYEKILATFEDFELNNSDNHIRYSIDYCQINRMYYLEDKLSLMALGLYGINMKTFVSIISLIMTFSVILIQT